MFPLRAHWRVVVRPRDQEAHCLYLFANIRGPESQLEEVHKLMGQTARNSLVIFLTEFDDIRMKHKSEFDRWKIVKHPVEVEPGATTH